ncbi:MAG: pyroglutamyl-peptidase I [Alphaproteobacteria bacterium]|nr:pyroglutamyl-peptidase I [Alphaproteobacteria bacterium]
MKALVTGFEPFGPDAVNPSREAVLRLPVRLGELAIETRILPTVFGQAIAALEDALVTTRPHIVLCVGLAGGRAELSLERVAINVDDARIPDNDGQQPIDRPIVTDGPAAYFTGLPVKAAVQALRAAGLPAAVSNTAGTFVCNHVFYGLMHRIATEHRTVRGGFLHVPYLPSQAAGLAGAPSMALDEIARGIEIILRVAAERTDDIKAAEGAIA